MHILQMSFSAIISLHQNTYSIETTQGTHVTIQSTKMIQLIIPYSKLSAVNSYKFKNNY